MAIFDPKDPLFQARVAASFSRQEAMRTLGVEIVMLQPGEIELAMPYAAAFTQQHGFIHAGCRHHRDRARLGMRLRGILAHA
jgi:acyl-coenzyme A thioesterase PaaI-like protein